MEELNRRNTQTVEQALKDMYKKIQEQQVHINGLNTTMGSLFERLNALEKMIILQRVKLAGTGSSVRE